MRPGAIRQPAIVLALTALLAIVPLLPQSGWLPAGVAVAVLTVLAWQHREPAAAALGLLLSMSMILSLVGLGPQQVVLVGAFAVYAVVVRTVRWLAGTTTWFRPGSLKWKELTFAAGIAAVSAIALLLWHALARPNLGDLVRTFVPDWPLWLLVPAALLLALVNAAVEEAAYRGVVLGALDTVLGPGAVAVLFQAIAFGALHFQAGFPRGSVGVGLAFVYGLLLGALRRKTDGLLGPWVAHVLTDLVIFSIVLTLKRT